MLKPHDYDNINVQFGQKIQLPAGAYVCRIKQVEEVEARSGRQQIKVQLDIAEGDFYNYWRTKWEDKLAENPRAGYPKGGTAYISIQNNEGTETNRQFKAFCEAYKRSNDCDINWTIGDWGKQFEGRFIGAAYGHTEQEYNGHKYMQPEIRYWTSVETVRSGECKIPTTKYLNGGTGTSVTVSMDEDFSFNAVDEDIPF